MWLLDALLPEFCVRCAKEGSIFCLPCRSNWVAMPIVDPEVFAIGPYKDIVLQSLLGLWKYHAVDHARLALLDIVESTVRDYQWSFPSVDAVTYVPLHWRKKNERGFDQAEETAKVVADTIGVPCLRLLDRVRYTSPQAQVDRDQRDASEFVSAFALAPGAIHRLPQRVIIVDDVWTTGTTIGSAAAVLRQSGVLNVFALTMAKG